MDGQRIIRVNRAGVATAHRRYTGSTMAKEKRYIQQDGAPLMTTTLWDYPSQNYPGSRQGDTNYAGATPSFVIWNLLQRYTKPKQLVVDPMAGSGTTLDVARDLGRRALGYDIAPTRSDIFRVNARALPLESGKADFVFIDPPYSTHIKYSGHPECIGELDARKGPEYFKAMEKVLREIHRVLKPDRHMALYVGDSAAKEKSFVPIGFELFRRMQKWFTPVDVVTVVRHNRTLKRERWHDSAADGNYFLRGFNYLFIMHKPKDAQASPRSRGAGIQADGKGPKKKSAARRKSAEWKKKVASRKGTAKKKRSSSTTSSKLGNEPSSTTSNKPGTKPRSKGKPR